MVNCQTKFQQLPSDYNLSFMLTTNIVQTNNYLVDTTNDSDKLILTDNATTMTKWETNRSVKDKIIISIVHTTKKLLQTTTKKFLRAAEISNQ